MAGVTAEVRGRIMEGLVAQGFQRRNALVATRSLGDGFEGRVGLSGGRSGHVGGYSLEAALGVFHPGILRWNSVLTGVPVVPYSPVVVSTVGPRSRGWSTWEFQPGVDPRRDIDDVVRRVTTAGQRFFRRTASLDGVRRRLAEAPGNAAVWMPIVLSMMGRDVEALDYIEQCRSGRQPLNLLPDDYGSFAEAFVLARPLAVDGPPNGVAGPPRPPS